jgi:hypothetical protein
MNCIAPNLRKNLLNKLLCILGAFKHAQCQRVEDSRESVVESLEGGAVSFGYSPDYGGINLVLAGEVRGHRKASRQDP